MQIGLGRGELDSVFDVILMDASKLNLYQEDIQHYYDGWWIEGRVLYYDNLRTKTGRKVLVKFFADMEEESSPRPENTEES